MAPPPRHTHMSSPPSLTLLPKIHISNLLLDLFNSKTNLPGYFMGTSNPVHLTLTWPIVPAFPPHCPLRPGEKPPPLGTCTSPPTPRARGSLSSQPPGLTTTAALMLGCPYGLHTYPCTRFELLRAASVLKPLGPSTQLRPDIQQFTVKGGLNGDETEAQGGEEIA